MDKEDTMRRHRGVGVALLLAAIIGALHGSFFPIGPAGFATVGDSSYLPQVESLGGNWAWVDCVQLSMSAHLIGAALDTAYAHGFRILLSDAGIDSANPGLNLANIAGGKLHNYESDGLCVPGDVGVRERDTLALDYWAWVVDSSSDMAGVFQTDTTLDYLAGIWDLNWGNPLPYNAYFRLRTNTAGMGPDDKVCSLAVTTLTTDTFLPHVESLVVCSTLVAGDFPDSTTYVEFRLQFEKRIQHSMVPFRYKVYWFRNARKLWSDYVKTYDNTHMG